MKQSIQNYTFTHVLQGALESHFFQQIPARIIKFVKAWTLPLSMLSGFAGYFLFCNIHVFDHFHKQALSAINLIQPILIFMMLFVTFCKIDPRKIKVKGWHLILLAVQLFSVLAFSAGLFFNQLSAWRPVFESAMICMITPTATAAAVITVKLGGKAESITTYNILSNLLTAVVVPVLFPLVHPLSGQSVADSVVLLLSKVFPMLICPLLAAILVQQYFPFLLKAILAVKDLAFYLWAIALSLAIAVTTRSLFHSNTDLIIELSIAMVSLVACLLQFYIGRLVGAASDEKITAGQALGQKSTVFAIWLGYTFLSPITALAGGFYSVWHNVVNSYQLYQQSKKN